MRAHALLLLTPALLIACSDSPVDNGQVLPPSYIINGVPDAGRHPYVGFLVFDDRPGHPAWSCTGSLLSRTVVLTAGHCTDGAVAARIWMTEDLGDNTEVPFSGATSYDGTPHTNPDYCALCGPPSLPGFLYRDLGIVVLKEAVRTRVVDQYLQLPAAGLVGTLQNKAVIELTGYGVQNKLVGGGPPEWGGPLRREYAPTEFVSGTFSWSSEFVRLTANGAQGKGGLCFGDSGGPDLVAGTRTAIAVNSYVTSSNCTGVTYSQRIDLPVVLNWIRSYLH